MATIKSQITVGLELECVKLSPLAPALKAAHKFEHRLDHSIHADDGATLPRQWPGAGTEIITPPLIADVSMGSDGRNLKLDASGVTPVIEKLCASASHVNKSCGVHVHLGKPSKADVLKSSWEPERVRTMLIIGKILEPVLLSHVPISRRQNSQCSKISERYVPSDFAQFYPTGPVDAVKYSNTKRYCWLNLIETVRQGTRTEPGYGSSRATGTIEIRLLGETANAEYIQAWTLMWLKIAAYVAYVPSAMAISHVCYSDLLVNDLHTLQAALVNYSKPTAAKTTTRPVGDGALARAAARARSEYGDPFSDNPFNDNNSNALPARPVRTARPSSRLSPDTRRRVNEALQNISSANGGTHGTTSTDNTVFVNDASVATNTVFAHSLSADTVTQVNPAAPLDNSTPAEPPTSDPSAEHISPPPSNVTSGEQVSPPSQGGARHSISARTLTNVAAAMASLGSTTNAESVYEMADQIVYHVMHPDGTTHHRTL